MENTKTNIIAKYVIKINVDTPAREIFKALNWLPTYVGVERNQVLPKDARPTRTYNLAETFGEKGYVDIPLMTEKNGSAGFIRAYGYEEYGFA